MRWASLVLVVGLALGGGLGFASCEKRVTEPDKQLFDLDVRWAIAAEQQVGLAVAMLNNDPDAFAAALVELQKSLISIGELRKDSEHLRETFGPPEKPLPLSVDSGQAARDDSKKQHSKKTPWEWIAAGAVGLVALVKAASKYVPVVAKFFSGPYGAMTDVAIEFIDGLRRKGKVDAEDLAILAKLQENEKIRPLIAKLVKKYELTIPEAAPPATTAT